jgi:hypothetical protein
MMPRVIRNPVRSSSIKAVGYNPANATLEVEFLDGDVYRYFMVPASVAQELLAAPSLGKHFVQHIKPRFSWEKVLT